MEKVCNVCKRSLPIALFNKHPSTADRFQNQCRPCRNAVQRVYRNEKNGNIKTTIYEKTKSGFLMRLYRNMRSRITGVQQQKFYLYKGKELLSKDAFYEWAQNNKSFHKLFSAYEKSGYDRRLAPSVDRIDSSIGYVIKNMQFITHSQNSAKANVKK